MIILGVDPGLNRAGWGIISFDKPRLKFVKVGHICTDSKQPLEERLAILQKSLLDVIESYKPARIAFEETFINTNPASALKLGLARGALISAAGIYGEAKVTFYAPNTIKKAVTGQGHANKAQVEYMVKHLLPAISTACHDESDALGIALCDAFHSHSIN